MKNQIRLGIVMDSIKNIKIEKDSSFIMLLEAYKRGYQIYYMQLKDIFLIKNEPFGSARMITEVKETKNIWYKLKKKKDIYLKSLDIILMRKDPPYNMEYIYATHILERAEIFGTLVVNCSKSLRNYDEKVCASFFTHLVPKTIISKSYEKLSEFHKKNHDVILKPLGKMGGELVFRLDKNNFNAQTIIETITKKEKVFCIMQEYVPEVIEGDKRILIINEKVIPYCLARIPQKNSVRANLLSGGIGEVRSLKESDWKISKEIANYLKRNGIFFAGIDIIGKKLIEINITSPTCIREIESQVPGYSIIKIFFDQIEIELSKRK
ncbi:glutathione synthase [Candidatus Riesia pediculicola]|uniref:glutathione synthase n=1 Tax=Candidatus Riesia pediculicola TaxID=401619 RepID=UPI0009C1C8B2|nr:glutathione synthase [Candidatus Riesia pediculicola]ARC54071.1 glutathione synthetase [Candidatus Riesia pediculicola]